MIEMTSLFTCILALEFWFGFEMWQKEVIANVLCFMSGFSFGPYVILSKKKNEVLRKISNDMKHFI